MFLLRHRLNQEPDLSKFSQTTIGMSRILMLKVLIFHLAKLCSMIRIYADPKPANPDESQLVVISLTENANGILIFGVHLSYLFAHVCPTKPWFDATPMLIDS